MDPILFMETKDHMMRDSMLEIANLVAERRRDHNRNLAVEIANQVGKLFGGK
jgi:hypothetical protein